MSVYMGMKYDIQQCSDMYLCELYVKNIPNKIQYKYFMAYYWNCFIFKCLKDNGDPEIYVKKAIDDIIALDYALDTDIYKRSEEEFTKIDYSS